MGMQAGEGKAMGRRKMEECRDEWRRGGPKGRYKKNLKLNLQNDRVAGLLELENGRACNLQNDRACSLQELQELELQMSVLYREKKCKITV